ncbi:MAG: TonB-dependent receptor [Ignavibacteria bacterium]|nr:TonB-dependent receptor [Ignavibacteria bacterium]
MTMYVPGSIPMYMLTWPDVDKTDGTLSLGTTKQLLSKLSLSVNGWGGFVNTSIDNEVGMGELMIFYPDFTGKDSRFVGGVSAGFRYFPSENISAGINYSFNKRSHTISEQYAFYIFNRLDSYDYVGDPYLKNETVNQFELNVLANTGKLRLETSAFGYFFSDYILGEVNESLSAMTEGSRGVKIYQNIPSAKLLGFEQTADYQISSKFRAINNIQYTYGIDNLGEYLPQIPPLMGSLSIRFSERDYLLQAETVWAAAQRNVNEIYGESQSPSFVVFNLRGSLKLFKRCLLMRELRIF